MQFESRNHMYKMSGSICDQLNELIPSNLKNVLIRASKGRAASVDVQQRDDRELHTGESKIRQSNKVKDEKLNRWIDNLKDEVNKLTEEHTSIQKYIDECMKKFWYFQSLQNISKMCKDYRKDLECGDPNDQINQLLDKEIEVATNAAEDTFNNIRKLREFLARLEEASKSLRCELQAKTISDIRVKACQQSKPLLSEPYLPEEVMNPTVSDTELEWERKVHNLIMLSINLRLESRDFCVNSLDIIEKYISELAEIWNKTNYALNDEINKDEVRLDFIHKVVTRMDKEINASRLRMSVFHNEYERQNLQKTLDAWRLQRLNARPKTENIRDKLLMSLEEELYEIEDRMDNIVCNFKSDQELLENMETIRCEQSRKIDILVKRLFANRENCRGLRRSVLIDGLKQDEQTGHNFFYVQ